MRLTVILCCCVVAAGCASIIDAPERLTESTALSEGYGTVIGSVLLSVPIAGFDGDTQKRLSSLSDKDYEAIAHKRTVHDYGVASRVEYSGNSYRISFKPNVEKRFILLAPAGNYQFIYISQVASGMFARSAVCLSYPTSFRIQAGKVTYIGRLTIVPRFLPFEEIKMPELARKTYELMGGPKTLLDLSVGVADNKDHALMDLHLDRSGIDTDFIGTAGKGSVTSHNCPPSPWQ